jgi:hypothetical protein
MPSTVRPRLAPLALLLALARLVAAADAPAGGPAAADHEHDALLAIAGAYTVSGTFVMMAGADPTAVNGTATFTPILGGHFLRQDYHGSMMGITYDGLAIETYDRDAKRYTSMWCDSVSNTQLFLQGASTDGGATRTYAGQEPDAEHPGQSLAVRWVCTRIDPTSFRFEYYQGAGAQAFKALDVVYTRSAPAPPAAGGSSGH